MASMIKFSHITKLFPGNKALDDVNFEIEQGEVHALLGENGAGKSTLLNILHGVYGQYEGEIEVSGKKIHFKDANAAIEFGISKVHQEVSVVSELTVGQNIALGYEVKKLGVLIDYAAMYRKTDEILQKLGCGFQSTDIVSTLSVGEMQMILIAKALFHKARVISFDEPTAALTDREVDRLFAVIAELKAAGITILYVTHRLNEVFKIADRASILRDGNYICTRKIADITREELIQNMVGRDVSAFAVRVKPLCASSEVVLDVNGLTVNGVFENVSFQLHKGEILSFAGLVGAKRTDVVRTIFGADKKSSGTITIRGKAANLRSPQEALQNGIALIPENRKLEGFVNVFTNAQNVALAATKRFMRGPFVNHAAVSANCMKYAREINLSPKDPDYMTNSLSGGNQQKVIIAKWLTTESDILIFDEPTKGIDVGAKAEIYRLMEELLAAGKSIIMVSSELPEVIGLSDRVLVMREGRLIKELSRDELSEEKILHYAMEG